MSRWLAVLIVLCGAAGAAAQSTSIGRNAARSTPPSASGAQTGGPQADTPQTAAPQAPPASAQSTEPGSAAETEPARRGNPVIEQSSLIAVKLPPPRRYKVNDYLTIIVREQVKYAADGTANARRQGDLNSELDAFIKLTGGGAGASQFRRGKPNINYQSTFNQRNDAESEREDRLTTRITARIVDVKPNGNLIFEAAREIRHDDENNRMILTGGCRSIDVTPDNTVLSTQVADLKVETHTTGSVRNATRQGWLGRIVDWIRPL